MMKITRKKNTDEYISHNKVIKNFFFTLYIEEIYFFFYTQVTATFIVRHALKLLVVLLVLPEVTV